MKKNLLIDVARGVGGLLLWLGWVAGVMGGTILVVYLIKACS